MKQTVLTFLRRLFMVKLKPKAKPEYNGEDWDYSKYGCPDCGSRRYYEGPSGGSSTNICCANPDCRGAFNVDFNSTCCSRISNQTFRDAFPNQPEESEAYLRYETALAV